MALPTYVASGTASAGTTSPRAPTYPAGLAANDRLILQVFVRADDATCPTPSGWTYEFEDKFQSYGTQWIFSKLATGSESGSLNVSWTGTTTGFTAIAQIHAFRGVTTATRWFEPGELSTTIGGTDAFMPLVVTTGTDRLALAFLAGANSVTVTAATGETGGNWVEALAEVSTTAGAGATLQLQTADMASAGVLSGGTATFNTAPFGHTIRSVALIATGATLAVSAAIYHHKIEGTGTNTISATNPFMASTGDIVFAHIVAKHDSAAVAAFANHPTDDTGGFWELVHQNVSGTGPALRSAVFYRLIASSRKIDTISFIASSTPESMSATIFTISGGDGDNLTNFKSALSSTGDPSITLDTAPAADSTVLCFYGANGTSSAGTVPTGFTQLVTDAVATHHRYAAFYDAVSPVQSATFSTTGQQSVGILVEVPLLAAGPVTGTGVATRNSLVGAASGTVPQTAAPLDPYLTNLAQAVDYRRVVSSYYGPILRVQRSSDSTQQDIGYNYDNSLDETALLAFCGAGNGFVLTRYNQGDQSSGDKNDYASTVSVAPRIVAAGVVEKLNGKPCGKIVTGNNEYGTTTTFTPAYTGTVLSAVWAGQLASQTGSDRLISLTSGTSADYNATGRAALIAIDTTPPPTLMFFNNNVKKIGAVPIPDGTAFAASWVGDGTNATLKTGLGNASAAHSSAWNINRIVYGQVVGAQITERLNAGSFAGSGYIWYAAVSSANLETIRAAAQTYWGTPAVITGTGAATLNPLAGTAAGVQGVVGTGAATRSSLVGVASGTFTPLPDPITGTAAGTLNPLVGAASGTVIPPAGVISDPVYVTGTATSGATHTSASFTPSPNALVLILASARRTGGFQTSAIGFTSTALTFTQICGDFSTAAPAPSARAALYWAQAGPSPVPMTVTVTSASADRCADNVIEIAFNFSTEITNFGTNRSSTGDPSAAISAPSSASVVLGCGTIASGPATITHPFGTELTDISGSTNLARNICFQNGSGPSSASWSTTGIGSVAILVEIGSIGTETVTGAGEGIVNRLVGAASGVHATVGTAAATLNRLTGAAVGVHGVTATAAAGTLNRLVGTAAGTHISFIGTAAASLNQLSGVAVAVHGVVATADGTRNPLAGAATATHFPFFGPAAATLNRLSGAATGAHGVVGTAPGAINRLVGAAAAVHGVTATAAAGTLSPATGVATGTHTSFAGTGVATLNRLTGVATGIHPISGIAAGTLNPLVGSAVANHVGFFGTGAGIINSLANTTAGGPWSDGTLFTDGTGWAVSGTVAFGVHGVAATASSTLNRLTGAATGVHGVVGTAPATRNSLVGNAFGTHGAAVVFGNAAGILNSLAGAAIGVHGTVATAAGTLTALLGNAAGTHVPFIGTAAGTCSHLTGAATGVHGVVATAAGARNKLTGAAVATHISAAGTAAGVLLPYAGASAGVHGVTATKVLGPFTEGGTGTGTVSATSSPFMPDANSTVFVCASAFRNNATVTPPTITSSPVLTWTEITFNYFSSWVYTKVWRAVVGPSPASITVTVASTSAAGLIVQCGYITGAATDFSNLTAAQNSAGDMTVALPSAPAANSYVTAVASGHGSDVFSLPAGFDSFGGLNAGGNLFQLEQWYDATAPGTGVATVSANARSNLIALEIKAGVAAEATLNPLAGQALGTFTPATVVGTGAGTRASLIGAAAGIHPVTGVAVGTRNVLVGDATGQHTVLIPVGVGAGICNPLVGLATGVHGVVGTAAVLRNQLLGNAVGISGLTASGEAAGVLEPLVGEAFGRFDLPTFPITIVECPVTGFRLDKYNAVFDPERRMHVHRDALDEPTSSIRPIRRAPPVLRLR